MVDVDHVTDDVDSSRVDVDQLPMMLLAV